ncbi:neutral amino acid transporter [Mortierella sp. 14UC]|nr:neutral amino acid transporter [Mortierella sp. 14UC]
MDPLGHAPVYGSCDNQPIEQHIQSGSRGCRNNDNSENNESVNSEINSSNMQTPQALSTDPQGGTRAGTAPRHDVNQDPCARISSGGSFGGGPISYDFIKACLDSDFGFPAEVRQDTLDTVKSLITNFYVFEDLAAHPPKEEWSKIPAGAVDDQGASKASGAGGNSVESEAEKNGQALKQDEAVEDNDEGDEDDVEMLEAQRIWGRVLTKMTDREFHDGVSRILLKARDGHLSYDADCFRAFRFQHGFFMSHVVRDGKTVIKIYSVAPYFPFQNGIKEDILNFDVLAIDGRDAVDYIQDWADRHVSMSKDENIQRCSGDTTVLFGSGRLFLPGKFGERSTLPIEKSLLFTFRCPTNSNLRLNVKWVGFYTHEQTKPFTNAETYFKSNCLKDSFDLFGDEEDEGQSPDRSKLEKQEDPEKKDISELKSSLREKGGATPPLPSSEEDLSRHLDETVTKSDMNCCKKIQGEKDIGTKKRMLKENVVRILIDFAVAAVAYAGYYSLDIVISFIGSFACAPLLFIFPPLLHVKAFPNQLMWRKISDIVLILFGFLVLFYTLVATIQRFSKGGGGGH